MVIFVNTLQISILQGFNPEPNNLRLLGSDLKKIGPRPEGLEVSFPSGPQALASNNYQPGGAVMIVVGGVVVGGIVTTLVGGGTGLTMVVGGGSCGE